MHSTPTQLLKWAKTNRERIRRAVRAEVKPAAHWEPLYLHGSQEQSGEIHEHQRRVTRVSVSRLRFSNALCVRGTEMILERALTKSCLWAICAEDTELQHRHMHLYSITLLSHFSTSIWMENFHSVSINLYKATQTFPAQLLDRLTTELSK